MTPGPPPRHQPLRIGIFRGRRRADRPTRDNLPVPRRADEGLSMNDRFDRRSKARALQALGGLILCLGAAAAWYGCGDHRASLPLSHSLVFVHQSPADLRKLGPEYPSGWVLGG